jgi:nucleotide-binding universal stress UspA family protein
MKTQIKSILIPTDFSDLSESALKVGIAIAKRQTAEITLLHVIDRLAYLPPTEVFLPDVQITTDFKLTMEEKLKALAEKIQKETGIKISVKVLIGTPSDSICQFAFSENISLIVMGTHGTSGLREFFIGSEAFRVVKNAICPVLTIPGNWKKTEFKNILFPVRLLLGSFDKYFFARPIIEKNDSNLVILGLADKKKPDQVEEVAQLLDEIKYQLDIDYTKFSTVILSSDNFPAEVVKMADKFDSDLIIVTTNLDHDIKTYFVGPFVQQIVNHSMRPVLSIKPIYLQADGTDFEKLVEIWGMRVDFSDSENE